MSAARSRTGEQALRWSQDAFRWGSLVLMIVGGFFWPRLYPYGYVMFGLTLLAEIRCRPQDERGQLRIMALVCGAMMVASGVWQLVIR